jgi:hypothetical protein
MRDERDLCALEQGPYLAGSSSLYGDRASAWLFGLTLLLLVLIQAGGAMICRFWPSFTNTTSPLYTLPDTSRGNVSLSLRRLIPPYHFFSISVSLTRFATAPVTAASL